VSVPASCFYFGEVVHRRFAPRLHRLRYRAFQGFFDLDELPALGKRLKFFSHNKPNLFAFHDADHGDGAGQSLRGYIESILAQAELPMQGGRICLLCMPRVFGFVFNPLSIYYCFTKDEHLNAIIYEVRNTFGERHSYVLPVNGQGSRLVSQRCAKKLYVSPFMDLKMYYDFKLTVPGGSVVASIAGSDIAGRRIIFASFGGRRRELSDRMILSALVAYPFLTLGVVAAIHWEALKLFAKGLRLRARPAPPVSAVTVVSTTGTMSAEGPPPHMEGCIHKLDKQSA
jgi:DUF1365 family protein